MPRPAPSRRPSHPSETENVARLPPPEASVRAPAPESSALTIAASNFINAYWANAGANSDQVLPYLSSVYAPVVDYYGKPVSKESVLNDKYSFMRRWPIRRTWPSSGAETPKIFCNDAKAECEISGVRDFDAASAERGARSTGLVRYSYQVRFAGGSPQIIAEDSKVVAHE